MSEIGRRRRRMEDPRLVRGEGAFVADLDLPDALHAGFVRSPYAHARIRAVDLSQARPLPGVLAAYAAGDLPELARETAVAPVPAHLRGHGLFPLAPQTVRYVGEPVAVVLANDRYALADAVEAVIVEYEPLHPVIDVERALAGEGPVWDDVPDNVALRLRHGMGDVDEAFRRAEVVVEGRFAMARAAGAVLEPRAVAAVPGEGTVKLTLWDSTQAPHGVRRALAGYLGLDEDEVRVVAPDVGGGFGPKGRVYAEEYVLAGLALRLGRPIRWVASRGEDLLTTGQGRGQIHHAQLAARADGTILALRDRILQDVGFATPGGAPAVVNTARHLLGPYRVPAAEVEITAVYTNKVATCPLRGGGRPEGVYTMERLLDRLAERLGLDRAEVRRRNFIPPHGFPYDTGFPGGYGGTVMYDSGDFPAYLEKALELIDYPAFRRQQEAERRSGRYLGLGLAAFIESTGTGEEEAHVRVADDGSVQVQIGSPSTGQGHATTFAQVVAERLGAPMETIRVASGDTAAAAIGTGTIASRMAQYGSNAASLAAREVRSHLLRLASDLLEAAPEDLEIADGRVSVRGFAQRAVTFAQVAAEAARRGERLAATTCFQPEHASTWAGGVNAAVVEVDVDTGRVALRRYVVVHDAGTLVNPTLVEGQIHGGVAHGVGNVLFEECVYRENGDLATATLADYSIPGAGDMLDVEIAHLETPTPWNPEGIKGAGEGGTIAAIPTLVSAVEDALKPFGVTISDVPVRQDDLVRRLTARSG